MEKLPSTDEPVPISPDQTREKNREEVFRSIMVQKLISEVEDALEEHDFSLEEVEEFEHALRALPAERILGVLAIPYELKNTLFGRAKELVDAQKETMAAFVNRLDANAQKYGFTLGYHISRAHIPKTPSPMDPEKMSWNITGNELDDRDDMQMAYYSLDYQNLFRKNRGTILYLVRAEIGERTAHKRDLKNNWGRAPQLSIIAEFDLIEIEERIKKLLDELEHKQKNPYEAQ